jgi:hypothetical protein
MVAHAGPAGRFAARSKVASVAGRSRTSDMTSGPRGSVRPRRRGRLRPQGVTELIEASVCRDRSAQDLCHFTARLQGKVPGQPRSAAPRRRLVTSSGICTRGVPGVLEPASGRAGIRLFDRRIPALIAVRPLEELALVVVMDQRGRGFWHHSAYHVTTRLSCRQIVF